MFKEITKEVKVKEYYCDFCGTKKIDIMYTCHKCNKLMCPKCTYIYHNNYVYFDLCKECMKSISHLREEQRKLQDKSGDIDDEVIKIIKGGVAS